MTDIIELYARQQAELAAKKAAEAAAKKATEAAERKKSIDTAKRGLAKGYSLEDVAYLAELPIDEVRKLAEKLSA